MKYIPFKNNPIVSCPPEINNCRRTLSCLLSVDKGETTVCEQIARKAFNRGHTIKCFASNFEKVRRELN